MKIYIKKLILAFAAMVLSYAGILAFPKLLFHHQVDYKSFNINSDREISDSIQYVLDDAISRLQESELLESNDKFSVFICNDNWRFYLFTRNSFAGGLVNFPLSPNVFIRESNIAKNAIVPPGEWMLTPVDRPLSYFVAHECTHALQRKISPFLQITTPPYILEGLC